MQPSRPLVHEWQPVMRCKVDKLTIIVFYRLSVTHNFQSNIYFIKVTSLLYYYLSNNYLAFQMSNGGYLVYSDEVTATYSMATGALSNAFHQQHGTESGVHVPRRKNHKLYVWGIVFTNIFATFLYVYCCECTVCFATGRYVEICGCMNVCLICRVQSTKGGKTVDRFYQ